MFLESLWHHCEVEGIFMDVSFGEELRHISDILEIAYKNKSEAEGFLWKLLTHPHSRCPLGCRRIWFVDWEKINSTAFATWKWISHQVSASWPAEIHYWTCTGGPYNAHGRSGLSGWHHLLVPTWSTYSNQTSKLVTSIPNNVQTIIWMHREKS